MPGLYGSAIWKGSKKTEDIVRKQIEERWGKEEAEKYDPKTNCFTFRTWWVLGFCPRKGEKALRSYTLLDEIVKDENGKEKVLKKYMKRIFLFYYKRLV